MDMYDQRTREGKTRGRVVEMTTESEQDEERQHCKECGNILDNYDPHPTLCVSCEKLGAKQ